jgi:lipoprotein-releasing system permease protein
VTKRFELFIALRYLTAKRKQAVISVITAISVIGVAAGVMALVIALAVNNGFRSTLQRNLLGATAHISVLEKEPGAGIENYEALAAKLLKLPGVVEAAPSLYGEVLLIGPLRSSGAVLKGIPPPAEMPPPEALRSLKVGKFENWDDAGGLPPIILGSRLARTLGMRENSVVRVLSPQGELTPFGPRTAEFRFRVVGIFESGFFDLDNVWAFTSIEAVQRVLSTGDVVNAIELRLADMDRAGEVARLVDPLVGPELAATTWMEQHGQLLGALRMERAVTAITIGLIQMVAALNILISLVMMVMEKHRDIALLMSMGARESQIRRIFQLQGVLIGVTGIVLGLVAGYTLSFLADKYRWIQLDETVYSLSFVPFQPRWLDGVWIAGAALLISFVATIYPARSATRIAPAEALRYE